MIFGIWPGVAAADLISLQPLDCPAEDTVRTLDALRQLQGTAREFYVRAYRHFGRVSARAVRPWTSLAGPGFTPGRAA